MTVDVVETWQRSPNGQDHRRTNGWAGDVARSRPATITARRVAVERVVATMRERLDAPLSLQDMADVAFLSRYHFNRVFRSITGIPPQTFLTCLRMQAAKKLLLTTALRVTDVCFSVGYQSVGTFTSRFTELVGVPPRRFRELSKDESSILRAVLGNLQAVEPALNGSAPRREVLGKVSDPEFRGGAIFVGLFPTQALAGCPAGCAFLTGPDAYRVAGVADGHYRIMAAGFGWSSDIHDYLLPDHTRLRVGAGGPIVVCDGMVLGDSEVTMRPMEAIDPPIVVALHANTATGGLMHVERRRDGALPQVAPPPDCRDPQSTRSESSGGA